MNLKKLSLWAAVALACYAVISSPNGSSALVDDMLNSLEHAANSVIVFLDRFVP
ncbi:hypothetical protein [Actinopolyspora erythraea]|uniref:hypothetical protein n=1 Tax=Actinopolyspora erythraea TaxID=414996 RepID=UPI000B1DA9D2|nr:hypothetical protein [Actinopolyspora erythraea]